MFLRSFYYPPAPAAAAPQNLKNSQEKKKVSFRVVLRSTMLSYDTNPFCCKPFFFGVHRWSRSAMLLQPPAPVTSFFSAFIAGLVWISFGFHSQPRPCSILTPSKVWSISDDMVTMSSSSVDRAFGETKGSYFAIVLLYTYDMTGQDCLLSFGAKHS